MTEKDGETSVNEADMLILLSIHLQWKEYGICFGQTITAYLIDVEETENISLQHK